MIWPEHDPLFPRAGADRVHEWFTDVEMTDLTGVGRFLPVEAAHAFASVIQEVIGC